jgi:hypothetical protein
MFGNSSYDDLGKNTGDRAFKDTPEMSFDPSDNFDYVIPRKTVELSRQARGRRLQCRWASEDPD